MCARALGRHPRLALFSCKIFRANRPRLHIFESVNVLQINAHTRPTLILRPQTASEQHQENRKCRKTKKSRLFHKIISIWVTRKRRIVTPANSLVNPITAILFEARLFPVMPVPILVGRCCAAAPISFRWERRATPSVVPSRPRSPDILIGPILLTPIAHNGVEFPGTAIREPRFPVAIVPSSFLTPSLSHGFRFCTVSPRHKNAKNAQKDVAATSPIPRCQEND